jgi:acyl carrier protein phosphodiesterase
MNYLAHVYLARYHPDAMLGALLGDFCRPGDEARFNPIVQREIAMHRRVDAYTDAHPLVLAAKARFRPETRRFAGIALDVFFDHMLARHWDAFSAVPLPHFARDFYAALGERRGDLPPRLEAAITPMVQYDWLNSYADFSVVEPVLRRIGMRLSRSGEVLQASAGDLAEHYLHFSDTFHSFFPQLIAYVEQERGQPV